jgi:hypothetical protein
MGGLWRAIQQHAAGVVMASALVALVVGCALYLFALRPCPLILDPGTYVSYRLRTEVLPVDRDGVAIGPARHEEQSLDLLCYSGENDVALIAPGEGGNGEVTLVRFAEDGRARRYDASERLLADGKALGFFDFNLLPLPQGMQQDWDVTLTYAALPVGRRQVRGQVERVGGGTNPDFELRLPTVEWVEPRPYEHYRQVRDLVCRYGYNSLHRVVERAELRFTAVIERPEGPERYAVRCTLEMLDFRESEDDVVALRDMIMGTVEAQAVRDRDDHERLRSVLRRLAEYDVRNPALRNLVRDLEAREGSIAGASAPAGQWLVQVASVGLDGRVRAQRLIDRLHREGFPADLHETGRHISVVVGPYPGRDEAILERLVRLFPRNQPFWRRATD